MLIVSTEGPKGAQCVANLTTASASFLPFEEATFHVFFCFVALHFTPMKEKDWEDRAPGLCLKQFAGAETAGAQGLQQAQTGGSQKMKDCFLPNYLYAIIKSLTSITSISPGRMNFQGKREASTEP